jgi:hypothetical protein
MMRVLEDHEAIAEGLVDRMPADGEVEAISSAIVRP